MWTTKASVTCRATPDAVWSLWTDVAAWPTWDDGVEWCRLDGAFEPGARGEMKPKGGPTTRFQLLEVKTGRGFSDRSFLPLTHLDFEHEVEPLADGQVKVTHTVRFHGPLAFFFRRVIGKKIAAELPGAVKALAQKAEERAAA
jgi:hypothetical protein